MGLLCSGLTQQKSLILSVLKFCCENLADRVKTGLGGNAGEPSRQTCPHEILAGQAGDFAESVGAPSWLSVITPVDLAKAGPQAAFRPQPRPSALQTQQYSAPAGDCRRARSG